MLALWHLPFKNLLKISYREPQHQLSLRHRLDQSDLSIVWWATFHTILCPVTDHRVTTDREQTRCLPLHKTLSITMKTAAVTTRFHLRRPVSNANVDSQTILPIEYNAVSNAMILLVVSRFGYPKQMDLISIIKHVFDAQDVKIFSLNRISLLTVMPFITHRWVRHFAVFQF